MYQPLLSVDPKNVTKQAYRVAVWDFLESNNLASFPRPVHHRIPNFQNAAAACNRCAELKEYQTAHVVKVNPDKPQERIRFLALESGKTVLVPTPRLQHGLFNQLMPPVGASKQMLRTCSTSEGVRNFSKPLGLDCGIKVDCIVIGSVAVSPKGYRIGKGEGYADLEYAMLRVMGAVDQNTAVVTTVHDCQVFEELPDRLFEEHDLCVDYICTPTRIIKCEGPLTKPEGIFWSKLTWDKLRRMPVLNALRTRQQVEGKDVCLRSC